VLITLDWDHDYCKSDNCGASVRKVLMLAEVTREAWAKYAGSTSGWEGEKLMCERLLWSNCVDLNTLIQDTRGVPRGEMLSFINMNVGMPFPALRAERMAGVTVKNWCASAKMARLLLEAM
jgi:hypothetical protein